LKLKNKKNKKMAELKQYKVVLLGDSGVGKTTLVKFGIVQEMTVLEV